MITLCIRPGSLGNVNQNLNDKLSRTERTFITVSKASQYTSYSQLCNILHTVNSAIYFVQSTLQYTSYSQLCNIFVQSTLQYTSYSQLCNILRTVNSAIYFVQSTLHFTEVDLNMSVCKFCASYANARLLFTHTLDITVNWTFHVMMLCQSKEDVCTKTF